MNVAASGSGYNSPNGFKLRLRPFCPASFRWQLLLAPAVMQWDCLRSSGSSSNGSSFLMGFILSWLTLLDCLAVLLRERPCKERADLRWLELPESHTLGQRQGLRGSYRLKCCCWYSFGKVLILPLYFNYRVAVACGGHTNTWLKTEYCCASTVEQSHKVVVWRPRRSFRGKLCSGTAEIRSRPTGQAGCCWTIGFHSTWVVCSDQLRISRS